MIKNILIGGGTGLIGSRLSYLLLERGYNVIVLSREPDLKDDAVYERMAQAFPGQLSSAQWDTVMQTIDPDAIKNADAIINLAGAGVLDQRWTDQRKKEIVSSRTQASSLLIKGLRENENKIQVVVNASAIGWYGEDEKRKDLIPFSETVKPAPDFLGKCCRAWEESIEPVKEMGKRLVIIRTGIVLSNAGGAYPEFKRTLNLHVASVLGNGAQMVSWIHIDDVCNIYISALENEEMEGVFNAVAPFTVTNERLVKTIAEAMYKGKYAKLHVPKTILKIAMGEMSQEVLKSTLVSSKKILDSGFSFDYPRAKDAVAALVAEEEKK